MNINADLVHVISKGVDNIMTSAVPRTFCYTDENENGIDHHSWTTCVIELCDGISVGVVPTAFNRASVDIPGMLPADKYADIFSSVIHTEIFIGHDSRGQHMVIDVTDTGSEELDSWVNIFNSYFYADCPLDSASINTIIQKTINQAVGEWLYKRFSSSSTPTDREKVKTSLRIGSDEVAVEFEFVSSLSSKLYLFRYAKLIKDDGHVSDDYHVPDLLSVSDSGLVRSSHSDDSTKNELVKISSMFK